MNIKDQKRISLADVANLIRQLTYSPGHCYEKEELPENCDPFHELFIYAVLFNRFVSISDGIGSAQPDSGLGSARRQAIGFGFGSKAIKSGRIRVEFSNPTHPTTRQFDNRQS
jgi:hypothetical protein